MTGRVSIWIGMKQQALERERQVTSFTALFVVCEKVQQPFLLGLVTAP